MSVFDHRTTIRSRAKKITPSVQTAAPPLTPAASVTMTDFVILRQPSSSMRTITPQVKPERSEQTQQELDNIHDLCTTLAPIIDTIEEVPVNLIAEDEGDVSGCDASWTNINADAS